MISAPNRAAREHMNQQTKSKTRAGLAFWLAGGLLSLSLLGAPVPKPGVTLAWDPNPDPAVIGYRVYYGVASGVYTNMLEAGNATQLRVEPLKPGVVWYFAATDYDTNRLESDFSAEVSAMVAPIDPITNVLIGVTIESTEDGTNWLPAAIWDSLELTNPPEALMQFRAKMSITHTNL